MKNRMLAFVMSIVFICTLIAPSVVLAEEGQGEAQQEVVLDESETVFVEEPDIPQTDLEERVSSSDEIYVLEESEETSDEMLDSEETEEVLEESDVSNDELAEDGITMFSLSPATADVLLSGTCGTGVTWELDSDFTLTISGSGKIQSYSSYTAVPWYSLSANIKKIVVEDGITYIPKGTFKSCTSLEEITLPFVGREDGITTWMAAVFGYLFDYTTIRSDGSKTVDGAINQYSGQSGSLYEYYWYYIPQTLRKVTITKQKNIPTHAFKGCSFLEEINLHNDVETIGSYAFSGCSGIRKINLAEGLTTINAAAFSGCSKLEEIYVPSTVTEIGSAAFNGCSSMARVDVSDMDKWVEIKFANASANPLCCAQNIYENGELVTEVIFPDTIQKISGYVLYNAKSVKKIVVPETVTYIAGCAFKNCTSLEEITLPFVGREDGITTGMAAVFGYLFGETIIYDNGSKTVEGAVLQYSGQSGSQYAYYWYYIPQTLRKVTITKQKNIPTYAFKGCSFLEEINLHNDVETIGSYAFSGCSGIRKINLTESLTTINSGAFSGCSELKDVHFKGSRNAYLAITGLNYLGDRTVHFNDSGSCGENTTWEITFDEQLIIDGEGEITSTGYLSYFDLIDSVHFGKGISAIDNSKFKLCTKNTAYTVDNESPYFKDVDGMVLSADGKKLVAVPAGFKGELTVPDSVEYISANVFSGSSVSSLVLSDNVTYIDENAFSGSSVPAVYYDGTNAQWQDVSGSELFDDVTIGKYEIAYNLNGGTGTFDTQIKNYGAGISLHSKTPTLTGYTFCGWSTSQNGEVEYGASDVYSADADVTLYAVWEINKYDVIYNANGGTNAPASQLKIYNETLTLTEDIPAKKGYTFVGWATSSNGEAVYSVADLYTENKKITLYAVWAANDYMVTYNGNSGTGYMEVSYHKYDTAKRLSENEYEKTGYLFDGWATSANGTVVYSDAESVKNLTDAVNGNVQLYAVWSPVTYTVKYNANGGTGTTTNSKHMYDSSKTLTQNNFARAGHTFQGWATSANGDVVYKDKESVLNLSETANDVINLYAVWEIDTYTITYNANGGTNAPASQTKIYGQSLILQSDVPKRSGYTFRGWSTSASGSVKYNAGGTYTNNSGATLYAVWKANQYTVVYNKAGGTGTMSNSTFTYDQSSSLAKNAFTKPGYTFCGWATYENGTVVYNDGQSIKNLTTEPGKEITLYAVWKANIYNVCYDGVGATSGSMNASTHTYDEAQQLNVNRYAKTGYIFAGWSTTKNGALVYTDQQEVVNLTTTTSNVYLYAVWKPIEYTITYNANGGEGEAFTSTHVYDVEKKLTKNTFTKTGFTFKGWSTLPTGTVTYQDEQDVSNLVDTNGGNFNLYAVWERNTYPVSYFEAGNDSPVEVHYKKYDIPLTLIEDFVPSVVGYLFEGWSTEKDGEVVYLPGSEYTENKELNLYAKLKPIKYTIVFDANGGVGEVEDLDCVFDVEKALPKNEFTKEGYNFAGWSDKEFGDARFSEGEQVVNLSEDDGDVITLYAVWDPISYTICYNANQGVGSMSNTVALYDEEIALRTNSFERKGYTFAGWSTSENGEIVYLDGEEVANLTDTDGGRVQLYAVWERCSYKVEYNLNGGTGLFDTLTKNHGESVNVSSDIPVRAGYNFKGWTLTLNGVPEYQPGDVYTLDSDNTFFAVWEKIGIEQLVLDKSELALNEGETYTLQLISVPENADVSDVVWSSSNEKIATVDGGVVKANKPGKTIITVSTEDGNKTATCTVIVSGDDEKFGLIKVNDAKAYVGKTVDVVISIEKNPGIAIVGFDVNYDKTAMTLKSATLGDIFTGELECNMDAVPFVFNVYSGSENKTNAGNLVTLQFEINSECVEGDYTISLTNIESLNIAEEDVFFDSINGKVTVATSIPGDVTGDGKVTRNDLLRLAKHFSGFVVEIVQEAADVTGDGNVSRADLLRLAKHFSGFDVVLGK